MKTLFSGFDTSIPVLPQRTARTSSLPRPKTPLFGADADKFVYVHHQEREAVAVKHQQADVDPLDYQDYWFDPEQGQAFLDSKLRDLLPGLENALDLTGRGFLDALLTPAAIDPQNPPQNIDEWKAIADYSYLGRSDRDIERFFESKKMTGTAGQLPGYARSDLLKAARDKGLIYQLIDPHTGKHYYGVPPHVRKALALETPGASSTAVVSAKPAGPDEKQEFAAALKSLVEDIQKLPAEDELFEYTAQLMLVACNQGLLKPDDIPTEMSRKIEEADLGFMVPHHFSALEDLKEVAQGTAQETAVKKLLRLAAKANLYQSDDIEVDGEVDLPAVAEKTDCSVRSGILDLLV